MLAGFLRWWIARISELVPDAWLRAFSLQQGGILIEDAASLTAVVRSRSRGTAVTMSDASRMARRMAVTLKAPPGALLIKQHSVPAVPWRELNQLLTHELGRLTPFAANDLFWKWDGHANPRDRTRINIVLMMVPKAAVVSTIARLEQVGIRPDYLDVGTPDHSAVVPLSSRTTRKITVQGATYACAGLAVGVIVLPVLLQAVALHRIEGKLADLQPAVTEATGLRQALSAGGAAQGLIHQEAERNGGLLRILATVTQVLPDDTSLTDLSLRERQLTMSGRTASAPRLITGLAASPSIREPAFAAPVTRIEGATLDAFQIKARLAQ